MAFSLDLRKRVLAAVDGGLSRTAAARRYQVGRATITEWVKLRRETGSFGARQSPGRPRTIALTDQDSLRAQLSAQPDASLRQHVADWSAQHPSQTISMATMLRAIRRLNWTRKKSRSTPASKIPSAGRPSKRGSRHARPRTS